MHTPAAVFLSAAFFLAAFAAPARAALEFAATEISLKPTLGEKDLSGEFRFKNTGDAPVTITRVHSSCGCTVPEKPAEPIAPGATGVIPVAYKAADRQGPQTQQISVETSDGKTHDLRLVVDLPIRIAFAPRLLLFRGADKGPKTATVTYGEGDKTELLGVTIQSPAFEIVGEPKLEKGVLKLEVRHVGPDDADARSSIRIHTRHPLAGEHTDLLYVRRTP